MQAEWQQLASAASLVCALDLDGTLLPFAPTPKEAVIDPATADLLDALAVLPGVTLGIISGRPRELLAGAVQRFPHCAFAAEHGTWRYANGVWDCALPEVPQLDEIYAKLSTLSRRHPGAFVERKTCSVCL